MINEISGREHPLSKIFSKEFEFFIPGYQRPYAWTEKEAGELYDDLYDAFSNQDDETYFLGSIVLIKEKDKPNAEVIDGQQRLTTLTMLLAVISPYVSDKETWNKYLIEKGNRYEGISEKPRVRLRERDRAFFEEYVQNVKLDELFNYPDIDLKNESQKLIKDNCKLLKEKIEESFDNAAQIEDFGIFIINHCYLIAVSTPDRNAAFRIFSVMNDRGMNLLPIDIIKADVIGNISEEKQNEYTEKWEDMESRLKRQGFNEVIIHTRMIFAKTKAKANIMDEFKDNVQSRFSPEELIDNVLEPFSDAYACLTRRDYAAAQHAEEINSMLFWLNKVDNSDWMPTAIKFFSERRTEPEYILWFVRKYERLVAYLYITASDRRKRIDRYRLVLEEMERNPDHCLDDPLESIELDNEEKKEFMDALDGEIYKMTPLRRNYVILRLNSFMSDGANRFEYDPNTLTIEHVLPQTIKRGTEWENTWPVADERERWLNRIANLVPLTRKKNSSAQNFDFKKKRDSYFSTKNGVTTYPMTTQVLQYESWLPDMMEERQKKLLDAFADKWELLYTDIDTTIERDETGKQYTVKIRGADAVLEKRGEKEYVVLMGSRISTVVAERFSQYRKAYNLRNELIEKGIVTDGIFTEDYTFDGISLCSSVILGRNSNGVEWKDSSGEGKKKDAARQRGNRSSEGFDIEDEATYELLATGPLAYQLIKDLLEKRLLSDEEIENLKNKAYSKSLFSASDYPVLAERRDDHKGNGRTLRYRKNPVNLKGVDLYISTQWFEKNKADLIEWYRRHLQ